MPLLVLRYGAGKGSLGALAKDPRVELLEARRPTPDLVALAQRVAGTLVVAGGDPMRALTFAVTAGLRAPLVIAMRKRYRSEARHLLAAGASACVTLPLSPAAVTRLVKLLRPSPSVARMDGTLRLLLDPISRVVRYRNKPVKLSEREFTVLHCLSAHRGRPVSAEDLLRYVWVADGSDRSRQILDVYICHLRRKLAGVGLKDAIVTLRGFGYSLTAALSNHR